VKIMRVGDEGAECTCLHCECKTSDECDDPRCGCKCSGDCCNPYKNNPNLTMERELELVGS
jgi:hypothetical protein